MRRSPVQIFIQCLGHGRRGPCFRTFRALGGRFASGHFEVEATQGTPKANGRPGRVLREVAPVYVDARAILETTEAQQP